MSTNSDGHHGERIRGGTQTVKPRRLSRKSKVVVIGAVAAALALFPPLQPISAVAQALIGVFKIAEQGNGRD